MMSGDAVSRAYRPPTRYAPDVREFERRTVSVLRETDPRLYERWRTSLDEDTRSCRLDARSRSVIRVALDSIVHWSKETIAAHIGDAFDAGSNARELLEAIVRAGDAEGGGHAIHDGLEALGISVALRRSAGLPSPSRGSGLVPGDLPPERVDDPPLPQFQVLAEYAPDLYEAQMTWRHQERTSCRKELSRRVEELLMVGIDSVISWPEPLIDIHVREALKLGTTADELVETIVFCAAASEGARASNPAARPSGGGWLRLRHGLAAMERVLNAGTT